MQFQVPQFIEVEDKIFGQLTIKQFVYLAGGAGLSYIAYRILGSLLFSFLPIAIIIGFSCALAFFKVNNKPFIYIVEAAFKYLFSSKLYIWKKVDRQVQGSIKESEKLEKDAREMASLMVPKISDSKLKDLTWSLDIKESMYTNQNQR
jgi:hypothetical protein